MTHGSEKSNPVGHVEIHSPLGSENSWRLAVLWFGMFVGVALYVIVRLDLFPLATQVLVDGMQVEVPRTFYTIDHPFHIARSHILADAWSSFEPVRWVASHQGGYPAEYFPLGVSGIVAALHFLTLGFLAVESAYSLTVVGLFLLPGLAYWLMARSDDMTPAAALLAFTGHVAIASTWLQGGFEELIEWGLVTNAAGALFALVTLPVLAVAVLEIRFRWAMAATICISLSVVSNPRSIVALAIIVLAILLHAVFSPRRAAVIAYIAVIGTLSLALCATVVLPQIRYSEDYFFLHYQEYESVRAFLDASIDSVTWPIAALTLLGCGLAFRHRSHRVAQIASLSLILYATMTVLAVEVASIQDAVPQLELPRLMPFQRLLMLYLAGYAVVEIVALAAGRTKHIAIQYLGTAVAVVALLVVFTTELGPRAETERGLRPVPRIGDAEAVELAQMRRAVEHADRVAPENTAILVLGSSLSWHEQLWAPAWSDRRFYYDDWLWYWHQRHEGPYDYRAGHYYPNPTEAIHADYFAGHGIGAVVVTNVPDDFGEGKVRVDAANSELLTVEGVFGNWAVYVVEEPVPTATLDDVAPDQVEISPDGERISLSFSDAEAGTITVRQNWFPRWNATIDGEPVDVAQDADGYLALSTSGGDIDIELTYSVTTIDVVARVVSIAGAAANLIGLIAGPTPIRRWARRSGSEGLG